MEKYKKCEPFLSKSFQDLANLIKNKSSKIQFIFYNREYDSARSPEFMDGQMSQLESARLDSFYVSTYRDASVHKSPDRSVVT